MLIDWLNPNEMPRVIGEIIESPMLAPRLAAWFRKRPSTLVKAAFDGGVPVGLIAWECEADYRLVTVLVVSEEHRRQGIGTNLVDVMKRTMADSPCREIRVLVPETNLGAQLFYRSNGFRWVRTISDQYGEMYEMRAVKQAAECCDLIGATALVESHLPTAW